MINITKIRFVHNCIHIILNPNTPNKMKQILPKLLVVTFLLALTQQLDARKIEVTDALSTAKNFIANTEYGKIRQKAIATKLELVYTCLLYTSPSPRD